MIFDFFDSPELLDIQRAGFYRFLKEDIPQLLAKEFPIKVVQGNYSIELRLNEKNIKLIRPEDNPRDCILKMKSYNCKLYAQVKMVCKKSSAFSSNSFSPFAEQKVEERDCNTKSVAVTSECIGSNEKDIIYESLPEWVLLGQVPMMTKRGHFIINGSPRVIVHQVVRSPGIYFQKLLKKDDQNRARFYGDIIPLKGVWIRLEMTKKGRVEAKFKKGKKVEVELLQKCLQVIENETFLESRLSLFLSSSSKSLQMAGLKNLVRSNLANGWFEKPGSLEPCKSDAFGISNLAYNYKSSYKSSICSCKKFCIPKRSQKGAKSPSVFSKNCQRFVKTFVTKQSAHGKLLAKKTKAESKAEHDAFVHTYNKLYRTTQDKELEEWQKKKRNQKFFKDKELSENGVREQKSFRPRGTKMQKSEENLKLTEAPPQFIKNEAERNGNIKVGNTEVGNSEGDLAPFWLTKRSFVRQIPKASKSLFHQRCYKYLENRRFATFCNTLGEGAKNSSLDLQKQDAKKKRAKKMFATRKPENAFKRKKCSEALFATFKNNSRYSLGRLGREKINNRFGFAVNKQGNSFIGKSLANLRFVSPPVKKSCTSILISKKSYSRAKVFMALKGTKNFLKPFSWCKSKICHRDSKVFKQTLFQEKRQSAVDKNENMFVDKVSTTQLTSLDLCYATIWLYRLRKGEESTDDIDHSQNRRVRTSGELLQTQFENGVYRLKNLLSTKLQEWRGNIDQSTFSWLFKKSYKPRYNPKVALHTFSRAKHDPFLWSTGTPLDTLAVKLLRGRFFCNLSFRIKAEKMEVNRKRIEKKKRESKQMRPYKCKISAKKALKRKLCKESFLQIEDLYPFSSSYKSKSLANLRAQPPIFQGDAEIWTSSTNPRFRLATRSSARKNICKMANLRFAPRNVKRFVPVCTYGMYAKKSVSAHLSYQHSKISIPTIKELFSTKPITGALREFFGSNPLSQYMDQTNPLAEITHKRRLSSLGVGGVNRDSAGMAIRGIHPTHYGRICPIETPEGKNAGLVNSLAFYTKVDETGFLKTPYYRVFKGQVQSSLGFSFCSAKEESSIGLQIAPSDLQKSSSNVLRTRVSTPSSIPVRVADNFLDVFKKENPNNVQLIAISPIQMISVATSLIPFLEHNDANRALMGSNMQRQAVPLMISERPVVGTGLESTVIVESGHITQSQISGFASHVTANRIVVDRLLQNHPTGFYMPRKISSYKTKEGFLSFSPGYKSYCVQTSARSKICMGLGLERESLYSFGSVERARKANLKFVKGDIALPAKQYKDTSSIGFPSALILYASRIKAKGKEKKIEKKGFFIERAGKTNQSLKAPQHLKTKLSSRTNSRGRGERVFEQEDTRRFYREFEKAKFEKPKKKGSFLYSTVSLVTTFSRSNQNTSITEKPLLREFDWVQKGDILTDCSASNKGELAVGKNVLLAYIPWEGYNFEDAIVISDRLVREHVYTSLHIERYVFQAQDLKEGTEWFTKHLPGVKPFSIQHLEESGLPKIGTFLKEGDIIVGKIRHLAKKPSSPYERLLCDILGEKNFAARNKSLYLPKGVEARVIYHKVISTFENDLQNKVRPPDAAKTVHIFLGEKRVIQVGDKISGRHGNKGVISTILPRQDMPYLPDGTPIDLILNPLGVPSRMNVGQVLECLLGLAASYLNSHFKIAAFDEKYGVEASKSIVFLKLYQARLMSGQNWLFQVSFPGKTRLVDGRSGECFDQWITVGKAYILKLIHMVSEKIHARSTGPYALITQQPLRGRSNKGGQRLGEMEVWALEGFGAAYTLQELLTKKSDDFFGRKQIVDSILPNPASIIDRLEPSYRIAKGRDILGHPEIFKVLLCELQALCLDLGVYIVTPKSFQRTFLGVVN